MLTNPRPGDRVQLWYGERWRRACGHLHGRKGVVEIASRGKPRNHGVRVGGELVVVPAGNLRKRGES